MLVCKEEGVYFWSLANFTNLIDWCCSWSLHKFRVYIFCHSN